VKREVQEWGRRVGRSKNLKKAIEYKYYNRDEIKEGGSPASP